MLCLAGQITGKWQRLMTINDKTGLFGAPQINGIEIIDLLGKGGMSRVYRARQLQMDRIVAVKVLSGADLQSENAQLRFQQEAKLTSSLDHPNIVKVLSFGLSDDAQPYFVMEYLSGKTLADYLKAEKLSLRKFKDIFLPLLLALEQAHAAGMIHRDIKPGNIMICGEDSEHLQVKLLDFGVAKSHLPESQNLTKSGALIGSPAYMSPEQCKGEPIDARSDLYSLAAVMYEALCGETVFQAESMLEIMQKQVSEPPPTVSQLCRKCSLRNELAQAVLSALAKEPAQRPQTAADFAREFTSALLPGDLDTVPQHCVAAQKPAVKKKLLLVAAIVAIATVCSFTLNSLMKAARQSPSPAKRDEFSPFEEYYGADSAKFLALLNEAAAKHEKLRDWKTLITVYERLSDYAARNPSKANLVQSLEHLAFVCKKQREWRKAALASQRLIDAEGFSDVSQREQMYSQLKSLLNYSKRTDELNLAEPYFEKLLAVADKNPSTAGKVNDEIQALLGLSFCHYHQSLFDKAITDNVRLFALLKDQKNKAADLRRVLANLGSSYQYNEQYAKAAEAYQLLISLSAKIEVDDLDFDWLHLS